MLIILIYVDDIIVTGDSRDLIQRFICSLQNNFALKDLGDLYFFLGIEVLPTAPGLHLSQTKYINDVLHRSRMHDANPCPSPMVPNISLSRFDGDPFEDPHLYRSIVGALQYATLTRPDISFAVNKVSQFMHSPTLVHWGAVKRILRYLKGTIHHGITLQPISSFDLHAYSDADWAGSLDDRKSTSGFCIYLGSNIISWGSKKQATVARSSTESEFRCLATTCSELVWLQLLITELHIPLSSTPTLWCDNIGATFLAANPVIHARTKHVEIDFHFIRERVANKTLRISFISSKDQIADVFTK
jgi:Reverse transcriptase (RNA-dependent DNA polymerase)